MKQNKVDICLVDPPGLNIHIFLSPDKLSVRKDVTSDQTSDKTFFLEKIRTSRVYVALKAIWNYFTLISIKLR